jgi:hypothetical protein
MNFVLPGGAEKKYEITFSTKVDLITTTPRLSISVFLFHLPEGGRSVLLYHGLSNDFFNCKDYVASHVRTNEFMMEWKESGGERDLCEYNIPAFPKVAEESHDILKLL